VDYRAAGVDIDSADAALRQLKSVIQQTFTPLVLRDVGLFGGFFDARFADYRHPVLVASTDGVGTKLLVAIQSGIHHTIGQDLVHHCVNDILSGGAHPLFFLDYFATGKLEKSVVVAYSLARAVLLKHYRLDQYVPELGMTVAEEMLKVHRSYYSVIAPLLSTGWIKGIAHVTGGGILGNLQRILPEGTAAEIHWGAWEIPPVFQLIQRLGPVAEEEMRRVFNLGIGMVIVVAPEHVATVQQRVGEIASVIGTVVSAA